ncbi:MAG TPA: 6-phosphogluconolactonase [Pyrinomonadaceae bacterium]|nr:6-phosphogluconolactonase [Pyrinomonadaceae bacterium]
MKTFEKNGARIEVWRDLSEASARAAELFTQIALRSVDARSKFSVALSGGSTPKSLYTLLADDAAQKSLASVWPRSHVFWTDERCVPPSDPQSNYRMAQETLLAHVPVPEAQIYRMRGEDEPESAAKGYASLLETVFGTSAPRFDLILLGMGADAHTASIFPHSPLLKTADDAPLVAASFVEKLNAFRLTMTLHVLKSAANTIFLVSGKDKAEPLRKVFASVQRDEELPARWVRPTGGELVWLVDEGAARLLS